MIAHRLDVAKRAPSPLGDERTKCSDIQISIYENVVVPRAPLLLLPHTIEVNAPTREVVADALETLLCFCLLSDVFVERASKKKQPLRVVTCTERA
jgi:hypothetical protein